MSMLSNILVDMNNIDQMSADEESVKDLFDPHHDCTKWKVLFSIFFPLIFLVAATLAIVVTLPLFGNMKGLIDADFVQTPINTSSVITREDGQIYIDNPKFDENYDFKILAFADLHLDWITSRNDWTLAGLIRNIEREKPDFIFIAGDLIMEIFANNKIRLLGDILEKLQVPWGYCLGNHDGRPDFNDLFVGREDLVRMFESYSTCVGVLGPENVTGFANYAVHIRNSAKQIVRSFIFLDSGTWTTKEIEKEYHVEHFYRWLDESQLHYYNETIEWIQSQGEGGRKIPTSVVLHIPINEFKTGFDTNGPMWGQRREAESVPKYNSGLFNLIKYFGSTDSVFCGHDHVNDYATQYQDVQLIYVQNSGHSLYYPYPKWMMHAPDEIIGDTLLHLSHNGSFYAVQQFNRDHPEYFEGIPRYWFFGL